MTLSQKCQYALRSLFELAGRFGEGPVPIAEIAHAQAIPPRFLELILKELKQTGWVESYRGAHGGYALAVPPESLTVGEIIRHVEGPLSPVTCGGSDSGEACQLQGTCPFRDLWNRAEQAVAGVYDTTSLRDLLDARCAGEAYVPSYSI